MDPEILSKHMLALIGYAKTTNPVWPFASMLLDEQGEALVTATDCAHISPLYHAESLAIHMLITQLKPINAGSITLISTAEPDPLSQSSIHWANIIHEVNISRVFFGTSLETIQAAWPFGIDIKAREVAQRSLKSAVTVTGSLLENECNQLFQQAQKRQSEINHKHPGMITLSNNIEDFYHLPREPMAS